MSSHVLTLAAPRRDKVAPAYVVYSAWAVPVLVLGQFALLAAVPVAMLAFGAVKEPRVCALRWWTGLLAALYAIPLIFWLVRDDGAQSLSKDIHPAFSGIIVATSIVLLVKIYRSRKGSRQFFDSNN